MGNFKNAFYSLRKQRGLTQEQMAKALGISRSAVGMYEQGKREPESELLEKIADFFNVDMNVIHGKEPTRTSNCKMLTLLGAAGCSPGASLPMGDEIPCPDFVDADCAFMARGDSMFSKGISDGDVVYVRSGYVPDNKIACVRIGDEYLIKVVQRDGDRVHLQSDIPLITISGDQEDAEIVGQVTYILKAV